MMKLPAPLEETLLVVGIGLIGGSIAAAARQRGVARRVVGLGRDPQRLQAALAAGLVDDILLDGASESELVVYGPTLAVVCTPVNHIVPHVRRLSERLPTGSVITDAGSTKANICQELTWESNARVAFVGAHPIAGSERRGHEAADAHLFQNRVCVTTPSATQRPADLERVEAFWQALGMRTVRMSALEHDAALARTSHLPHVVASALAGSLSTELAGLTGTGFRDTTRVASGDPQLWTEILLQNATQVRHGLREFQQQLQRFEHAIAAGHADDLRSLLEVGRDHRQSIEAARQSAISLADDSD